ncbi:hypothetical protein BZG36_04448 [Bifiguratus adelaidae]|uniref:m7GpppX diphosphatase n=1 Tax=Bifiguratus adelaidae TaxID=1938954 RepID=A0A261XVD5_9FUNG|nr:hypothetical protein BZG36_04448 [Bifiguratus adelaidae]
MVETDLLKGFNYERTLNEDPRTKTVWLLGHVSRKTGRDVAILIAEKTHFSPTELAGFVDRLRNVRTQVEGNDIYHWFFSEWDGETDMKITLIVPATETHIAKYTPQPVHYVLETPDMYNALVKPFIELEPLKRIQWVYNIVDGTAESERVVLRTSGEEGFVLLPDMKWDGVTMDHLYLLVIVNTRTVRSIRDLGSGHLPLLQSIRDRVPAFVSERYGVSPDELRLFCHYQPSYYHFHVHVTHLKYADAPRVMIGQSHLLDTIIDNIKHIRGDYYQVATLPSIIGEKHGIWKAMQKSKDAL